MKRIIGQRAEWLVGDYFAYFLHNVRKTDVIACGLSLAANETFARYRAYNDGQFRIGRAMNGSYSNMLWGTAFSGYKNIKEYNDFVLKIIENDDFYFSVNGTAYTTTDNVVADELINCRFGVRGKCKYLNFNDNENLTPLVLTSSLPAYLSSNNLPHAAGECGMWDSVNEKFYGNANTSGEFSVENELDEYVEVDLTGICINGKYQRVSVENSEIPQVVWNGVNVKMLMLNGEVVWSDGILIGERYQYLAFKANLTSTDICEIPTIIDWPRYFRLQIKHSWNQQQYVTLWEAGNFSLFKPSNAYMLYYPNKSNTGQFAISGQLDFDCVINNEDGTCEGNIGSKPLNISNFGSVSGRLRLMIKADSWRNSGQVGECILTDLDTNEVKHHFIPCVLSIDIDENLSLLNTPHQQGTIGMWDIVTKKFTTNSKGFDVLVARNKQGFITK